MQKEAARHVYMPDCFFIALNIACETRIFLQLAGAFDALDYGVHDCGTHAFFF